MCVVLFTFLILDPNYVIRSLLRVVSKEPQGEIFKYPDCYNGLRSLRPSKYCHFEELATRNLNK